MGFEAEQKACHVRLTGKREIREDVTGTAPGSRSRLNAAMTTLAQPHSARRVSARNLGSRSASTLPGTDNPLKV